MKAEKKRPYTMVSFSQLAFFISQIVLSKHHTTLYNTALIMNPDYHLFSLAWLAVFKPQTENKACTA
jgi:hypothetical protein